MLPDYQNSQLGLNLQAMLDPQEIQSLLDSYCDSVGIAAAIIDLQGNVLIASNWQRICTDFHRINAESCLRCVESDTKLALDVEEGEEYSIYHCKNGLVDCAAPLRIHGEHVANVFVGQFLLTEPDETSFASQAERFAFNREEYLKALKEVPVIQENRLPAILKFLTSLASTMGSLSMERFEARHQARIATGMQRELEKARSLLEVKIHERTEELQRTAEDLQKRIKEQSCLSEVSAMINRNDSVEQTVDQIAKILPTGFQNPAAIHASIEYQNQVFYSKKEYGPHLDLPPTELSLTVPFVIGDKQGQIKVVYVDSNEDSRFPFFQSRAIFLEEENILVHNVARMVEQFLCRRDIEADLKTSKLEAEAANRAKSEFLASMSHEIRTPMNVVIGLSDVLLEQATDCEQVNYLTRLQSAGNTLLDLINGILDLSRIEAGKMTFRNEIFNPVYLLEECIQIFEIKAKEKGLCLSLQADESVQPSIRGDITRFRQVALNLLSNAIKFTEEGHVSLELTLKNKVLYLSVIDTGIGISPEKRERIFDRFTQLDSSLSRKHTGAGLGLTISKEIIEYMGGSIYCEGNLYGGTTMKILLPVIEESPDQRSRSSIPEPKALPDEASIESVLTHKQKLLKVLLAEDSIENQDLIKVFLKNPEYELDIAGNGMEAVERFCENQYDVILMDIQMPVMDGYKATTMIRQVEKEQGMKQVPVLALSAHALYEAEMLSYEAGCNAHLTKPIKKQHLLQAISTYAGYFV